MEIDKSFGSYKAFIPEKLGRRYACLNDVHPQAVLSLMRYEGGLEAFEILHSEVSVSQEGQRMERQERRFVKLGVNSQGQLCYYDTPNQLRVVTRDSKRLYLSERVEELMTKKDHDVDLFRHKYAEVRRPARAAMAELMRNIGKSEEEETTETPDDHLQISFVVTGAGKNNLMTIELYCDEIVKEIELARKKTKTGMQWIFCNGLIVANEFIIKGVTKKLERMGYQIKNSYLPEKHSGYKSHRRLMVIKKLN